MSYIAFHTAERTGYVSGAERAHLDILVRDTAAQHRRTAFGPDLPERRSALRQAVSWPVTPPGRGDNLYRDADLVLGSSDSRVRAVLPTGATDERPFDIDLNTVIAAGSPSMQLAARISGQCEVHMFVEGADRKWFADQINAAVAAGTFRDGMSRYRQRDDSPNGWRDVAELARSTDTGPIVLSYSVCDWFPNPEIAAWPDPLPDGDEDPAAREVADNAWDALTDTERWDRAMAGLRRKADEAWLLRLAPDNLGSAAFGAAQPLTWFDLAKAWELA